MQRLRETEREELSRGNDQWEKERQRLVPHCGDASAASGAGRGHWRPMIGAASSRWLEWSDDQWNETIVHQLVPTYKTNPTDHISQLVTKDRRIKTILHYIHIVKYEENQTHERRFLHGTIWRLYSLLWTKYAVRHAWSRTTSKLLISGQWIF